MADTEFVRIPKEQHAAFLECVEALAACGCSDEFCGKWRYWDQSFRPKCRNCLALAKLKDDQ